MNDSTTTPIIRTKVSVFGKRVHFNVDCLGWTMEQSTKSEYIGLAMANNSIRAYLEELELVPAFNLTENEESVERVMEAMPDIVDSVIHELTMALPEQYDLYRHEMDVYGHCDDSVGKTIEVNNEYLAIRIEMQVVAEQV